MLPRVLLLGFSAPLFRYVGRAFGVACLNLLTLGLYKPYGLTRVRQALYPHVRIGRQALAYHGTAKGLAGVTFYPSLAFLFLFIGTGILPFFLPLVWSGIIGVCQVLVLAAYYHYLFYANRRYERSQVGWRDLALTLRGSAWTYMWMAFGSQLIVLLSAGLLAPWRRALLARYEGNNLLVGRYPVVCTVRVTPLLLWYLPGWALSAAGFGAAVWFFWVSGVQPVLTLLNGGPVDLAMAGSVDGAALSASSGLPGAVPTETLAEIGTFMNALVLAFTLYPAWVVWRMICLAPYEQAWARAWAAGTTCAGMGLRYDGSLIRDLLYRSLSFAANFTTANLTRPFTTYFGLKRLCGSFVVTIAPDSPLAADLQSGTDPLR